MDALRQRSLTSAAESIAHTAILHPRGLEAANLQMTTAICAAWSAAQDVTKRQAEVDAFAREYAALSVPASATAKLPDAAPAPASAGAGARPLILSKENTATNTQHDHADKAIATQQVAVKMRDDNRHFSLYTAVGSRVDIPTDARSDQNPLPNAGQSAADISGQATDATCGARCHR